MERYLSANLEQIQNKLCQAKQGAIYVDIMSGNSTKTSNELFMIVDGDRKFHKLGYKAAVDAKNERMSKHAKSFGAKQRTGGGAGAVSTDAFEIK